jgi:hypothetical protein
MGRVVVLKALLLSASEVQQGHSTGQGGRYQNRAEEITGIREDIRNERVK